MRVNLEHPKGTVRNKIVIELNDDDLDHIRSMSSEEAMTYTLGYAAIVVIKREEKEDEK